MSIGSVGSKGTPDDQAITNWNAGPPILNWVNLAKTGGYNTGLINASNFGYLSYFVQITDNPVLFSASWWSDAAQDVFCGSRQISVNNPFGNAAEFVWPNLGSYVSYAFSPATGATSYHINGAVTPVNGIQVPWALPTKFDLVQQGLNLPASGSTSSGFEAWYTGRAGIHVEGGTNGVNVLLEYYNSQSTWRTLASYSVAANTVDERERIIPPLGMRWTLTNPSGAAASNNIVLNIWGSGPAT